ncbi:MAG: hypothetical protein HY912_16930 [Desulfomonile tiedjei]|uniref:Uncharacterized protein n=1 Tax=Desulfomonile tiedjei TaxID=2358 RepID=A0A9D6Z4Q2_9BACT|nr:hypothetical protein [Desulfomonile tiedjei]
MVSCDMRSRRSVEMDSSLVSGTILEMGAIELDDDQELEIMISIGC